MRASPVRASSLFAVVAAVAGCFAAQGCSSPDVEEATAAETNLDTLPTEHDEETLQSNPLPAEWPLNGSSDCRNHQNSEPTLYRFKYDENTFIFRENKCLNFEANFLYLVFGRDKVLLQDTGSIPRGMSSARFRELFPLRDMVESTIGEWLAAHPNPDGSARTRDSMELLVTHSHSHGDHVSGDFLFKQPNGQPFPHTRIAGLRPNEVASFFGIPEWPTKSAVLDLGERKLEVMPLPGHEPSHVVLYDHGSNLLFTGDSLYPGHIFVNDWRTFRTSIARLNAWMHETDSAGRLARPVVYVLGTHIEKKPAAGQFYPYPSWIQDPERKLELLSSHLDLLASQMQTLGAQSPGREIFFDDFSIDASN